MNEPELTEILTIAIDIAQEAGVLLRDQARHPHLTDHKSADNDLVTETDRAAETLIVSRLTRNFPDHQIMGEEGGDYNNGQTGTDYRWFIDPLDGTTNFAHGIPHYCVSMALAGSDGWPLVGVIYDPMRDECFAGAKGRGASLNGQSIQVSSTTKLSSAVVASGFPYDKWTDSENNAALWGQFVVRTRGVRRMGSAALDLAYVATGRFDGYWEQKLNPWDVLAGVLLVLEAGGIVSDYNGRQDEIIVTKPRLVVSNGGIHDAMLAVLRLGDAAPRP